MAMIKSHVYLSGRCGAGARPRSLDYAASRLLDNRRSDDSPISNCMGRLISKACALPSSLLSSVTNSHNSISLASYRLILVFRSVP